jgi:hypothetical protein
LRSDSVAVLRSYFHGFGMALQGHDHFSETQKRRGYKKMVKTFRPRPVDRNYPAT